MPRYRTAILAGATLAAGLLASALTASPAQASAMACSNWVNGPGTALYVSSCTHRNGNTVWATTYVKNFSSTGTQHFVREMRAVLQSHTETLAVCAIESWVPAGVTRNCSSFSLSTPAKQAGFGSFVFWNGSLYDGRSVSAPSI